MTMVGLPTYDEIKIHEPMHVVGIGHVYRHDLREKGSKEGSKQPIKQTSKQTKERKLLRENKNQKVNETRNNYKRVVCLLFVVCCMV